MKDNGKLLFFILTSVWCISVITNMSNLIMDFIEKDTHGMIGHSFTLGLLVSIPVYFNTIK